MPNWSPPKRFPSDPRPNHTRRTTPVLPVAKLAGKSTTDSVGGPVIGNPTAPADGYGKSRWWAGVDGFVADAEKCLRGNVPDNSAEPYRAVQPELGFPGQPQPPDCPEGSPGKPR
ncbi:hypothetical protein Misp04_53580 [Micromonospora sp. NBRC 101691]|nr:hypothetical protein Misp04_53580 [Micromonospora sp. NBRC 101691]